MKTEKDILNKICTFDNALDAYYKARKCKRYRPEVRIFESYREENLFKAIEVLKDVSYNPGKYTIFKVYEPKERIIMALPFFDRVIHHMIVNHIEGIFEKRFINTSYACRKGKGVHEASKQLTHWIYNLEIRQGLKIYAIKADIHHYFQSINHIALKAEIRRYISDRELIILLDRIIDHNGIFEDGTGIPVGNLTSQLFANVYLNMLDQFVKHKLHAKYYIRYMDDFIILSDNLDELRVYLDEIEVFLKERLKLSLNPKTTIIAAKNGVDFVGYRHFNSHKKIRKDAMRKVNQLFKEFESGSIDEEFFNISLTSRIGHIRHADAFKLCESIEKHAKEARKNNITK